MFLNYKIDDLVEVEIRYDRSIEHGWISNIKDGVAYVTIATVDYEELRKRRAPSDGGYSDNYGYPDRIVRKLNPFEFEVDFKNGIKGNIADVGDDWISVIQSGREIAKIYIKVLDYLMIQIVEELLKMQKSYTQQKEEVNNHG